MAAISHQPPTLLSTGSQLTTELSPTSYFTSLHSTELLKTFSVTRLTLLIKFQHKPHRKHHFHCYSPTIPGPLHGNWCFLFAYFIATAAVYSYCLTTGIYAKLYLAKSASCKTPHNEDYILWQPYISSLIHQPDENSIRVLSITVPRLTEIL
jgi:hypothetical protein